MTVDLEKAVNSLDRTFETWSPPPGPAPARVLVSALIAGLVSAAALGDVFGGGLGINVVIAAVVVALAVLPSARSAGRVDLTGAGFALAALCLVSVGAVRDAAWIVGLCMAASVPLISYALVGGRSWTHVLAGGLALPFAGGRMLPWAGSGVRAVARSGRGPATLPIIWATLTAIGLLLVFGALFAGADAAFRDLLGHLVPPVSVGTSLWQVLVCVAVIGFVLAATFLALAPPPVSELVSPPGRPAGRWVWAVPLVALNLLFVAFAAVQATVLLTADKDRLLRSTGLGYAEYARQGFFQLVIVTVLVLVVVAVAVRYAPRGSVADRAVVRSLLGALCGLTLVVVAVALRRLYLYEEAYGWTRLRLWVHAFELWLGVVIVLIAAAGIRLRAAWLPGAVAGSAAAALITLAALNPDGFIAQHNVARYNETGKLDTQYLYGLSADAVPALRGLPEPHRVCALEHFAQRLDHDEGRLSANLGRHRARAIVADRAVPTESC
ncbi:DUF4153 domain-containing protein [Actinomadura sp. HBU206391]|uniref:DUF4153 domain-containing protein n=1 Tax=Actinomadura sp. HBU206391 TaxID=2731692 RepID=UPI00164F3453|nr:DUF4173 domain-containing protein [Actinomadura sp. HBU206391]MBC6458652.1 DUF4173 domain-containing protein [Actinomadura sp. HBU206391]